MDAAGVDAECGGTECRLCIAMWQPPPIEDSADGAAGRQQPAAIEPGRSAATRAWMRQAIANANLRFRTSAAIGQRNERS